MYVESVYQKVLLGDIAARNKVRNPDVLRVMMKKVAETVCQDVSYSSLHHVLRSVGYGISKDTLITYMEYVKEGYLLFSITNAVAKFVERESNPKYYFSDNGLLSLFLYDRDPALLENEVAVALYGIYGNDLHYLKSSKHGVDVDFYIPDAGCAIQVAYSIAGAARRREIDNLVKLHELEPGIERLLILTMGEAETVDGGDCTIEVMPVWRFLLSIAHDG